MCAFGTGVQTRALPISAGLTGGGTGRGREGVGELPGLGTTDGVADQHVQRFLGRLFHCCALHDKAELAAASRLAAAMGLPSHHDPQKNWDTLRWEEHTSELQSLMLHSYAVLCLK